MPPRLMTPRLAAAIQDHDAVMRRQAGRGRVSLVTFTRTWREVMDAYAEAVAFDEKLDLLR